MFHQNFLDSYSKIFLHFFVTKQKVSLDYCVLCFACFLFRLKEALAVA